MQLKGENLVLRPPLQYDTIDRLKYFITELHYQTEMHHAESKNDVESI